jgi:hypothetical protein
MRDGQNISSLVGAFIILAACAALWIISPSGYSI